MSFTYGRYGDRVMAGDWDGNGTWAPGVLRGGTPLVPQELLHRHHGRGRPGKQTPGAAVVGDWDNRP